ncbi:GNAT family N-acetyltransferase [Jiangella alba]|uniref:Protein N-acetyltransferase, RimJ/RimL family n=1 Tax=Jiangella alba TaxID=561176 RepID=A0A1H5P5K1_9ACTN|nr:GNAT family N-acetyltransferase [Jiangella alba]SEF09149.1 Protein N-acetyltransferase, RimJ/RimL family [Jiangella alba]
MTDGVTTDRLLVRPPQETDRARFLELFQDEAFMAFAPAVLTPEQAGARFDHMADVCRTIPFGKQPVVERATGRVVGYTGVDHIEIDGRDRLEWGYRFVPEARGLGYATEAGAALLEHAGRTYTGELLAIIDPGNGPSKRVAGKLGFAFWTQTTIDGDRCDLYTLRVGQA